MVSPLSLNAFAVAILALAVIVARFGGTNPTDALADGRAALIGASLLLGAAVALFSVSAWQPAVASDFWRLCASVALLASAPVSALALRQRGHRSMLGGLTGALIALGGVMLWLILNLRGPRAGWTVADIALVLPAAAVAVASGACLGRWSTPVKPQASANR